MERAGLGGDGRPQAERSRARASSSTAWPGRRTCGRRTWTERRSSPSSGPRSCSARTGCDAGEVEGDFMRGKGTHDPGLNPNSYPMTDAAPAPERGARRGERRRRRGVRPPRRPRRPPGPAVLARPEAGRPARARPAPTASSSRRPSPPRPCARPRRRARSSSGWRWTRRCPGGLAVYGEGVGALPARPEPRADPATPLRASPQGEGGGTSRSAAAPRRPSRRRSALVDRAVLRRRRARRASVRGALQLQDAGCPRAPSEVDAGRELTGAARAGRSRLWLGVPFRPSCALA